MPVSIATFYRFADLPDFAEWRNPLLAIMRDKQLRGTILLAPEGVNGTIAGPADGIAALLAHLETDRRFADLFVKYSEQESQPFARAKVRLKDEIITLGLPAEPASRTGRHMSPEEWNQLVDDPNVVLLDTRNRYETHLGSFTDAIVLPIDRFTELPDKILSSIAKDQPVAMFCTGGIRCEKLSSWMLSEGYTNVMQLDGGILHYLNEMPETHSRWQGDCYVFDERVAVSHGSVAAPASQCPACGHALTAEDHRHPNWLPAICCGHCPGY